MLVLGINGNFSSSESEIAPGIPHLYFHDASASLVLDGQVLAAVEEERFNRVKKTNKFPSAAVRFCLEMSGVAAGDVDAVAYAFREDFVDLLLNDFYAGNNRLDVKYSRTLIQDLLQEATGRAWGAEQIHYVSHHRSHGASAFVHSGMEHALVVVMDGSGEEVAGTVFEAGGSSMNELATYSSGQSLGLLYWLGTRLLGYSFGDEYKVMGLAPYGRAEVYREVFDSIIELRDGGDYYLAMATPDLNISILDFLGPAFLSRGFTPRRQGEKFSQDHMDFAAGLQEVLERIVMHVLRYWSGTTGYRRLCFTGGVAHNSTLNGRILRSGLFDEVFVHPASHDAGAGQGAAMAVELELTGVAPARTRLRSASLGPSAVRGDDVEDDLRRWGTAVRFSRRDDISHDVARLLAEGAVVGWVQGRSEFGPRALGNRSILADPRDARNKDRINSMVKKRESYRPFAPVVTTDAAAEYFELPDAAADYEFMSFVVPVREAHRHELGAVTHVDGSARLQVVHSDTNPRFHRLVKEFGALTGTPVLLNTSFNSAVEPIVQTIDDAVTCFLTTEIDHLVVEDFIVERGDDVLVEPGELVVRLRPATRLGQTMGRDARGRWVTRHEIRLEYVGGPNREISPALFDVFQKLTAAGESSLRLVDLPMDSEIRREVDELWRFRYVTVGPP